MNAIESIPSIATARGVVLRSSHNPREVTISIQDSAVGPASYETIFEPFFTTKPKGMGLGLPIAKSILESHGGKLRGGPAPGGTGSIFEFTLPVVGPEALL